MREKDKRHVLSDKLNGGGAADRNVSEREMRRRSTRSNRRRHSPPLSPEKSEKEGNDPRSLETAKVKLDRKKEDVCEKRGSFKDGGNSKTGSVGDTEDDDWKEDSTFWETHTTSLEASKPEESYAEEKKSVAGASIGKETGSDTVTEENQNTAEKAQGEVHEVQEEVPETEEGFQKPEKKGVSDTDTGLPRRGRERNDKQKDVTYEKEELEGETRREAAAEGSGGTEETMTVAGTQCGKGSSEAGESCEALSTGRGTNDERATGDARERSKSRSPSQKSSRSSSRSGGGNRSRSASQKSSRSGSESSRMSRENRSRSCSQLSSKSSSSSSSDSSSGGDKRQRKGDKETGRKLQRSPRTSSDTIRKRKSHKKSSVVSDDEKHHPPYTSRKDKKSSRNSKEDETVACDSLSARETKKLRRNSAVDSEKPASSVHFSVKEKKKLKDYASEDEKPVSPIHVSGRENQKYKKDQGPKSDDNSYSPSHSSRKEKRKSKSNSVSRSSHPARSSSKERKKLKRKSSTKSDYEKKISPSYTSSSDKQEQRSNSASKYEKQSDSPVRTSSKERKKHRRDSARPDECNLSDFEEKRKRKHWIEQEQKENSAPLIRKGSQDVDSQVKVRKRKWGSKSVALKRAVSISTASLKGLIPDVKPVSLTEVKLDEGEDSPRPRRPGYQTEMRPLAARELEEEEKIFVTGKTQRKISVLSDDGHTLQAPSPPRNKPSNVLFITNLVRPFTINQLRELLARTGMVMDQGFWIDKIKSKCFVMYETEEQAIETRHALHGVKWPVSNPKNLNVDFSTHDDLEYHRAVTDTEPYPRKTEPLVLEPRERERETRRERRRSTYEESGKEDHKIIPPVREWDRDKVRDVSPVERESRWEREREREREERDRERDKKSRKEKRRSRSGSPGTSQNRKSKKKEEEAPAKLLDDLFRKTKTTPCIYWLPLTAEQILQKEELRRQRMAERNRRLAELQKAEKEKEHKSEDRDRKYGSSSRRRRSSSTSPRRHI